MEAFDLAAVVATHNQGLRASWIFYGVLSLVLWAFSYVVIFYLIRWPAAMIGLDLPIWLCHGLTWVALGALGWELGRARQRLRDRLSDRETIYRLGAASEAERGEELAAAAERDLTASARERAASPLHLAANILCCAPRLMAAALHARTAAIGWFESDCARGQQNFATLGQLGEDWMDVRECIQSGSDEVVPAGSSVGPSRVYADLLPGMETLNLLEHRIENGAVQVHLHPTMRRRYFPKKGGGMDYAMTGRR